MATTRLLLRSSQTSRHVTTTTTSSSSSSTCSSSFGSAKIVRCLSYAAGFNGESTKVCGSGDHQRKLAVPIKASVTTSDNPIVTAKPAVDRGFDLGYLLLKLTYVLLKVLKPDVKGRSWKLQIQRFIESAVINCRFFTLLAVAGSLLGSILCFVEGCFLILESYFKFLDMSSEKALITHLVIEAIDIFLVGTALLIFGLGLYVMFVGSKNTREATPLLPGSNLFGLFCLKSIPKWMEMESIAKAKSRIGHAVMMILQVGVLEKFNNIPIVTSLDLICFAGAVLLSSGCIFLLSRLSLSNN